VFGYINLTRAIYAQMKARGHGVIVNDIGAVKNRRQLYLRKRRRRADKFRQRARGQCPADNIRGSASIRGRRH
jgi:hypothetical protein